MSREQQQVHGEGDFGAELQRTTDKDVEVAYNFAEEVIDDLNKMGLKAKSIPTVDESLKGMFHELEPGSYFDGSLPTTVRGLTLDQLSNLYSLFCNWYGYVKYQETVTATALSAAKAKRDFVLARLRKGEAEDRRNSDKNLEPADIRATAVSNYQYVEANAEALYLEALHAFLEAAVKMADRDMKRISREVTIVQTQMEHGNLAGNLGRRGRRGEENRVRAANFSSLGRKDDDDGEADAENAPKRTTRKSKAASTVPRKARGTKGAPGRGNKKRLVLKR